MKKTKVNLMLKPVIGENLGAVCVMDLRNIRTTAEEARKLLQAANLPDEVTERKGKGALKEILKDFEGGNILVEVASNPKWTDYQLNLSKINESAASSFTEAEISKVAVVRLYKDTNTVEADNPELTAKVRALFEKEINTLKTSQIRAIIDRIIAKQGEWVNLTSKGGVYFVPNHPVYLDLMERIKAFCDSLPTGANYMRILPVANNEANKKDYWKKVTESLDKKAVDLKEKVNAFAAELKEHPETATVTRASNLVSEINMLEAQSEGYEILFNELQAKVRVNLTEVKEMLNKALS
jgi:hypothetical protein